MSALREQAGEALLWGLAAGGSVVAGGIGGAFGFAGVSISRPTERRWRSGDDGLGRSVGGFERAAFARCGGGSVFRSVSVGADLGDGRGGDRVFKRSCRTRLALAAGDGGAFAAVEHGGCLSGGDLSEFDQGSQLGAFGVRGGVLEFCGVRDFVCGGVFEFGYAAGIAGVGIKDEGRRMREEGKVDCGMSVQHTLAWLVTAVVLYVPANVYPIMMTHQFGRESGNTILGGVVQLMHHGSYLVAGIIFLASVVFPVAKILAVGWLCFVSTVGYRLSDRRHMRLYALTELLGRWSMVDVCVVAVLVSLVQMGGIFRITSGSAGLAFAGMVVATMLAAHSFDPRMIWLAIERREKESNDG